MRFMLLAGIVASGCAAQSGQRDEFSSLRARAKSVCEVTADPNLYAGQRILVQGIYWAEPHQRVLYDAKCPDAGFRVSHSLSADGDRRAKAIVERFRKRHPTVRIPVVYSGILTAHSIISGCTSPNCYRYSLEDSQLLAASPRSFVRRGE